MRPRKFVMKYERMTMCRKGTQKMSECGRAKLCGSECESACEIVSAFGSTMG
jgi:hypothetical protein